MKLRMFIKFGFDSLVGEGAGLMPISRLIANQNQKN